MLEMAKIRNRCKILAEGGYLLFTMLSFVNEALDYFDETLHPLISCLYYVYSYSSSVFIMCFYTLQLF